LISIVLAALVLPAPLLAQTVCDEGAGPLVSARPRSASPQDIIQKFPVKEGIIRQAWDKYTYTEDVTVQTLNGTSVDGEYRETTDVTYGEGGKRIYKSSIAPRNSLSRIVMTKQDFDDIRGRTSFVLTPENLLQHDIRYFGTQQVDDLDMYVFDVAPKGAANDGIRFQGRVWVDDHDLQIVKTCGRTFTRAGDMKTVGPLSLTTVTQREQIDGQYWFPTYSRADERLHLSSGDVQMRAIVKYTKYKRYGSGGR
jgi:hypothetical protein